MEMLAYPTEEQDSWFYRYSKAIIKFIFGWRWHCCFDASYSKIKFYGKLIIQYNDDKIFALESGKFVYVKSLNSEFAVQHIFKNKEELIGYDFSNKLQKKLNKHFKFEHEIRLIK